MADEVSPRTELRKRRQQRRRVVLVALRRRPADRRRGRRVRRHARRLRAAGGAEATATTAVENSLGHLGDATRSAPMRSAATKGGDVAVYASPDADAQPTTDAEPADRVHAAAQLPRVRPVPGLAARLPADPSQRRRPAGSRRPTSPSRSRSSTRSRCRSPTTSSRCCKNGVVRVRRAGARSAPATPHADGHLLSTPTRSTSRHQPGTGYGVFAIGLSGHSNVLADVRRRRRPDRDPRHRRHRHASARACRTAACASTTT